MHKTKKLLAIVGMPGAGKTEVSHILQEKHIPFVRFGELTEIGLAEKGLPVSPENEEDYREDIRNEQGMAVYAIKSEPKIKSMLVENDTVVIDGLYSWEEYIYLKERFPNLALVAVIAEPELRYERLKKRPIRPFTAQEALKRDIDEIEHVSKGGPIAMADYFIYNNSTIEELRQQTEALLQRIGIGNT